MKTTLIFAGVAGSYGYLTSKPKPQDERWKRTFKYGLGFGSIGLLLDFGLAWAALQREREEAQKKGLAQPPASGVQRS